MQVEAWLLRAARMAPDAVAIETGQGKLTYAELWDAARLAAAELDGRGARRGEQVAIVLPAGIDFAIALHACLLLGAIAVPIDLRLTPAERERTVAEASVVVERALRGPVSADALMTEAEHDLDAVCAVIHTSGTTSRPRPVQLTYGNFLWSALGSNVALGGVANECWLCTLPLAHVGGLSILLRSAIYASTAVIHERFDTERVLAALEEEQITLVSLVATTLARLLDAGLREPPALRYALTGGGPVPDSLVRRASEAGVRVAGTYGLTEACSQVSTGAAPLFCTRVRIEPDGEILVRGPTVAPGSVAADGWLHTGDLGAIGADGELRVSGRAGETIISGGENVAPAEVEAVLESHPDVLEAAVVGREDDQWGEAVNAVVVLRPDPAPSGQGMPAVPPAGVVEAELRAHCAEHLAPFKVPKSVTLRTTPLPRTRSGKLLRREL
ncbi:MAG TPA: AMP-binding protein [Solirubrobacteraceae bacterium]|nr:AMP-binding protein [Solirubrobacteraceae bacterium]